MTENQLTAQPLIPWEDFSAAVGVDRMPIPDRLATFKNYTSYVNEYGKELDSKTPEEGKPALRDWTVQQNDWATKEKESLLAGDFVSWQDVENSPSFQNATNSDRLRSFANYTSYFEDYADLKARNTPEQDRPAIDEWAKAQREWLMGGMDQAVEQYTLGGKLFSMTPMEQIDFLRTKDQSVAAGFTEKEWEQTREQFEESMLPLLEKHISGRIWLDLPSAVLPDDPVAKEEFLKNALWNESEPLGVTAALDRLPLESLAGIMSMVSGFSDYLSRDMGMSSERPSRQYGDSGPEGTGERRPDAFSQALGRFSDYTREEAEKMREAYPQDPRFSSVKQAGVAGFAQAPGQIAPFLIPGAGQAAGFAGMFGQLNQEAQNSAYQAELENRYKESVVSGDTPIGTPVSAWEKTLDPDVREDMRAKVAVQSAFAAMPATAMDFVATRMALGLQAVPGAQSVAKWLSKFREAKPGLGMAAKIGTDTALRVGTGTASEVVQQGITNLNAATISGDYSLKNLSEGFKEAAVGGLFGESAMAAVGIESSIKEQNRFLWAKSILSDTVNPEVDPVSAKLRLRMAEAEYGLGRATTDPEYRQAAKTWAAKKDEANWVLRSIGDPLADSESADRHVSRMEALGSYRNNLAKYLRDAGVQSAEEIRNQRDADLKSAQRSLTALREMHRGTPIERGVDAFEENLTRSANEKAAAAVSKAEEKLQEFIGSVDQDGPGRADFARVVISKKFPNSNFLFSSEFKDDAVVIDILNGIEQDLITDETNLAEWLQAPAAQTAPATTTPATQGLLTTGQRRDAIREANFNFRKASPEAQAELNELVDDVRFWDAILNDKDSNEQDKAEAMERLPALDNALLELATNPNQVSSQSPNPNDQNQTANQTTLPTQEVSATGAASEGVGTGVQTIRATNADGTQADYSQEDYAAESRGIVKALETGAMSPEEVLQNVESVRMEIEAAPELTPEQKAQWFAPFQNVPALVEQRARGSRTPEQTQTQAPQSTEQITDEIGQAANSLTEDEFVKWAKDSGYAIGDNPTTARLVYRSRRNPAPVTPTTSTAPVAASIAPEPTGSSELIAGQGTLSQQPTPARLNGVSGDVVRTEAGETVFRSAVDGAETVLRVKEGSIDKDPTALTVEDFESGDGTPLVSEADKQFSVLPQSERLVRPFFRTQSQNTEGGETPNEIQTQSLREGQSGSGLEGQTSPEGQSGSQGQSQVISPQGAGATPAPAAAPDIAAITADVQANPDQHRSKQGNRKLVSREAAVTILSQLPETLTNKDVATLAKDSGMSSVNFRKLAALRGDSNAVGSILNGDMDAELGLFDRATKASLNETTPAAVEEAAPETKLEDTPEWQALSESSVEDSPEWQALQDTSEEDSPEWQTLSEKFDKFMEMVSDLELDADTPRSKVESLAKRLLKAGAISQTAADEAIRLAKDKGYDREDAVAEALSSLNSDLQYELEQRQGEISKAFQAERTNKEAELTQKFEADRSAKQDALRKQFGESAPKTKSKVSNDTTPESTVVGQSSVDRWVNDSFAVLEQAAAGLPQSSINAALFREKLTTDEGRAEIREKLGQMFNTVFRNLKISDPVVREEAMEKIFRGALQKQTGEGLTSNVLQDLLANLKKTGDPFLVKSKNGEVGYSAWLKHRNKQNEFMEAQGNRDMTGKLVENEGAPTTASQGVQEEEGEGSGPAFTEGDPDIEEGRAEATSMIREATQRTYERVSREIAKQFGLDWEAVRAAITKSYEDAPAPKRISQQPTPVQIGATQGRVFRNKKGEVVFAPANKGPEIPLQIKKSSLSKPYERLTTQDFETANGESIQTTGVKQDFEGLGWATPQSAKIKKAAAALEATMPQIKQRLWSEMTVALRAAAQEANDLGLLKSDVVQISETPTLDQIIALGVIDEINNPDFYNAINEAREKKSPDALVPLLEKFSRSDIASLQVVTGIVLNSGKPITNKEQLASLNKADMQEVLDSNLLPVRLRQTLQALVDLSGEDGLGLVRNSKNEGFRRLAELYTEQIGNRAPVEVVFNFGLNPAVTGQGFWASGSNRVHISPFLTREKGLMEATILHEVMHPIWDRKITDFLDGRTDRLTANEQKTIAELQQLFGLAKAEAAKRLDSITDPDARRVMERNLLGAQDLREFLNEALNHKPFQDFLNEIKDPNAGGKTSVWRSILNKILELIRGGKVSLDSVLQRSFELSVDLANYTERQMPIEQRNPKQIDYFRQLERQKGRPLTPREAELAAVDFALQYPQPRLAETREEANRLAGEILSEGELANYNHELRTEGQSVLASETVPSEQRALDPSFPGGLGRLWQEAAAKEGGDAFAYGEVSPEIKNFGELFENVVGERSKDFSFTYFTDGVDVPAEQWDDLARNNELAELWVKDPEGGVTVFFSNGLSARSGIFAVNSAGTKTEGSGLYQSFYAWAHNNGKIVGPDSSLSEIAQLRRTSQMLSSALRFGTTHHMKPSYEQGLVGWRNVEVDENGTPWEIILRRGALGTVDGLSKNSYNEFHQDVALPYVMSTPSDSDDILRKSAWNGYEIWAIPLGPEEAKNAWAENIGLLAKREAELVFERIPELSGLNISKDGYLFGPDEEYPGSTRALPAGNTAEYLGTLKAAIRKADPAFARRIGPATLARALATRFAEANNSNPSLLSSSTEGSSPAGLTFSPFKEVLYSEAVPLPPPPTTPMPMSAVDVLYQDSSVLPKPSKKIKNSEVATTLAQIAEGYWGYQMNSQNITAENEQILVTNGVNEFISALQASGKNAGDWYSTAIEVAMGVAGTIHPEISDAALAKSIPAFSSAQEPDKAAQLVMRIALAITSQNINVSQNASYAEEQYAIFSSTGRFDSSKSYGAKATAIKGNLELANQVIETLGFEGAENFIKKEFTIDDLQKEASALLGRPIKIAGKLDDLVNGAALFGPKIGQGFLQNLMGRFDPVTIDLWLRRTWGRWTGDVVGDGVTEERMARLLDAARAAGLTIPKELQSLRTVERKRENGNPFRTMSEAISERLENDPEFRQSIVDLAAEFNAKGQAEYRLTGEPVTPETAARLSKYTAPDWEQSQEEAYRAAKERGDDEAAKKIQGDTLEQASKQFIREQQRIKNGLDKKWDDLRKAGKKPAMPKAEWVAQQHTEAGRTEKLANKVRSSLKSEWSLGANVIVADLNPIDIPSPQDRRVITRIVNKIREELSNQGYSATNADVQAVLWYPEKDIWAKLSGKEESNLKLSYDDEFIAIAEKRGLGEQARAVAERIRADRAARTGGQNDTRANEATDQTVDGTPAPQEGLIRESAPVPFQGNVLPGFNPSVSTRADARKTTALAAVLSDPEYRSVQAALNDKRYFASREGETLKKANEFIDANGGDLQKAFINTSTAYGLTPEQAILVRGLALKRAQAAANAARVEMRSINSVIPPSGWAARQPETGAVLRGATLQNLIKEVSVYRTANNLPVDPDIRRQVETQLFAQRMVNLQFIEQHYSDLAEDFAESLMENASLTGQGLRAYGLLADALAPKTWANTYKKAAQRAQVKKFAKDPVLKDMMARIKAARQNAANSTTVRMQKALAMAAKRFMPEGTTDAEIDAYEKFARLMASNLSVREEVMQAAVEQTVVSGIETIRRAIAPGETIPDSFLREWENRLRKIATDQINAVIEQRLQGGQVDPEARELSEQEKEAEREQKLLDMWREFSDYPLAEIVFNLARSTVVASDSPYANLVRKAQFDPERIKNLRKAVQATINTAAEVRKSVADRRMSVEALKLRLAEANPSLTEAQLGRLAAAVEAVYNEEVARATRSALDQVVREHSKKKTAKVVEQPDFLTKLLPLVNMGAFSDEAVYNAVADKLRLPTWNPDVAAEIEAKANELQALPEGSLQRQEAAQRLMSDILKANIKEARGARRWGPIMQISSALWSAGILSGPPTQIVNASMSTVSVFAESLAEATGYWINATANGATQAQARAYYGDIARAWLFAAGKDANNTSLRSINEVHNALTKGQSKFKSEKLEDMSPLELFKFHPRVAIPGNKMMDAIISGEGKTALKEAMKMAVGVPVTMAQRVATADVKGAVKDYAATMKLVGRLMLAADAMNSFGAMATKEMMMRRYLAQEEGMAQQEIDRVMREARQGGNEAIRDAAMAQAEDEAQRGDFGPVGTTSHEVQKARRIEQLIEQQVYDADTINAGRDFAAFATFNNEPYGVVGWLMDTLFAGPTKVLGIATKPINPFPKTVSNLVNSALNYTPYGSLRAEGLNLGTLVAQSRQYPQQFFKEAPERGTPEYYALHTRAAFGTAAMGIFTMMLLSAIKDREEKKEPWFEIHGPGPSDPAARKQWAASGAKKFSVKIGNGDGALVLNYADWPALNLVLGVLGTFYDEAVYGDLQTDPLDWLSQSLRAVALTTLNRNFLGGAAGLFEILSASTPDEVASMKMGQLASSYATGFTRPSFVRWAETIATGTRQETSTTEGWLLSMTPVVSAFRDRPALNILGEPIGITPWDATAGRVVSTQQTHPILTPLTDAQLWINPAKAYPIHDPKSETMVRDMTKAEFYDYGKAYGEALKTMLPPQQVSALAELSKTAPNTAQEMLNNLANVASNIAKAEMAGRGMGKGKEFKGP